MRILVLSDVHGNLKALQEALEWGERQGAERIWYLGDTFGIGSDGAACFDLLKEKAEIVLLGNHDAMALGVNESASSLISLQSIDGDRLRRERPDILKELIKLDPVKELQLGSCDTYLVHAGVADPLWLFTASADVVEDSFTRIPHRLLIAGHTHTPAYAYQDGQFAEVEFIDSASQLSGGIDLTAHERIFLNPGAVGIGEPSCAILTLSRDGEPQRFDWR